jgi:hypothetical protein
LAEKRRTMDRKIVFVACLTLIIGVIAFSAVYMEYLGPNYWIGLVISVACIIGIIYAGIIYLEKQRKKEMGSFAKQIGFRYIGNSEIGDYSESFPIFEKGHSKKIKNLIEGHRENRNWKIFDYYYTEGYGKNSQVHTQTLIIPELKSSIPEFTMCPENIFHKIGNIFGYKDIDFDTYPEFSKKYLLKGKREDDVRKIFSPEIIRRIEKIEKKICLESDGKSLVCYLPGQNMNSSEMASYISALAEISNILDSKKPDF